MIFAKAPILGWVKTRLIPALGARSATQLYEKLLIKTLEVATESKVGPVELWCTPSTDHPFFLRCQQRFPIDLCQQADGDLGRRMANAFQTALRRCSSAILIGSDCPSLTAGDIERAHYALASGSSAVIAPAEDGGYVLIGLRQFDPSLFEDIAWGEERVFEETAERIRHLGWDLEVLPERWDVDRPKDLERLQVSGLIDL